MRDIIERLVADLRWRFSAAGKRFRPKHKEKTRWGALRLPAYVPLLVWVAYIIFCLNNAGGLAALVPAWLSFVLFSWPGWLLGLFGLVKLNGALQRGCELSAYRRLLLRSERATLVEYMRYLERQIHRAREDPALGGPAEVQRLRQLTGRLTDLLQQGAGRDIAPVESKLGEEAQLAQAVIEAYEESFKDPLTDLDARLPDELRSRVEAIDRELAPPVRSREAN